jgi:hypothetical protein
LAFIVFNLIALPLVALIGRNALPAETTGGPRPAYEDTAAAVGEGAYPADDPVFSYVGVWDTEVVSADKIGADKDAVYRISQDPQGRYDFVYNGQKVEITYSAGPDRGIWAVEIDGGPYIDADTDEPLEIDAYNKTVRYGMRETVIADEPGEHTLSLINTGTSNEDSRGTAMTVAQVEVQSPIRESNLLLVVGLILVAEAIGVVFARLVGKPLFSGLAERLDTRASIILALSVYAVIAIWGFFLDSTLEFWLLAWMVAMVQGGSQGLSRSLYASMAPAAKSGEFFGLYGVMEKFSAIIGPLLFAAAAATFDSSRPAILSLIVLFLVGILLLTRVDIDEGRRVAREEDAALLGATDQPQLS